MPRRLLVTGGAGFIGSAFVRYWLDQHAGDFVVVLDALTYAGVGANLAECESNEACRFVEGDIGDQPLVECLLREERLDTLVHFAAETHVDRSIAGSTAFVQTNIVGTHSLLQAARAVWLQSSESLPHRFHHVSTDEVYGSLAPDDPPFSETTAYQPNSPYAASKAGADHLVRAYHETHGLQTTLSHCSNNFGPGQHAEKMVPTVILNAVHGRPIPIYGDGMNVRDWLFVDDHVQGIDAILARGRVGETYNIGGNNEMTNLAFTRGICRLIDDMLANDGELRERYPDCPASSGERCESAIRLVADRPGHDRRYALNAEKIRKESGFVPQRNHEAQYRRTIDWYLKRQRA